MDELDPPHPYLIGAPKSIICPEALIFKATKANGKTNEYMLTFTTKFGQTLDPSALLLSSCTLYKKHPKYTKIALRNFNVRQDTDIDLLNNQLLTGNFSNIILPPIVLIQKFISDTLPGQTFSSLESETVSEPPLTKNDPLAPEDTTAVGSIICPRALKFSAKKANGKTHNYILVFITSLNSLFPLDIPTACILYKVSHKKHPKYTQIALRKFIVRQDRENRFIYNNLLTGNFSNILLPPIVLIQKFISDALPGETCSSLTVAPVAEEPALLY